MARFDKINRRVEGRWCCVACEEVVSVYKFSNYYEIFSAGVIAQKGFE